MIMVNALAVSSVGAGRQAKQETSQLVSYSNFEAQHSSDGVFD